MRLRIDLAYDGAGFHGWARQPGLRTVQGVVEQAIVQVLRLPRPPSLVVAGRTDAGVHARGQVCHVDLSLDRDPSAELSHRLRRMLPTDIAVHSITSALPGFDARFSALWRRYCYRLTDRRPDPLLRGHVTAVRDPLDVEVLNTAAQTLTGLRDFAAFCKPRDGATTIRELRELTASRRSDGVIEIHLLADAFCHSMVRSLVGALIAVAGGRHGLAWLEQVATSTVRHGGVGVMPAHGLTLEEVGYPAPDQLASRAVASRAMRSLGAP